MHNWLCPVALVHHDQLLKLSESVRKCIGIRVLPPMKNCLPEKNPELSRTLMLDKESTASLEAFGKTGQKEAIELLFTIPKDSRDEGRQQKANIRSLSSSRSKAMPFRVELSEQCGHPGIQHRAGLIFHAFGQILEVIPGMIIGVGDFRPNDFRSTNN